MRRRSSPYLRSFSYVGLYRYHLIFCTHDRHAAFVNEISVGIVREAVARAAAEDHFGVVVYCFMPDHLHLLVEGQTDASDCRRFITHSKQYSAFRYAAALQKRLWQRLCFEHILRDDETTRDVGRYILNNPIRAGLVTRVEDYPFVGSLVHTMQDVFDWAG